MSNIKSVPHFEPYIKIKNESGTEDVHYHALYEELPEEFKRYAREHLNETEENKERGLEKLKAYIRKENQASIDDDTLLAFLRCCKYDIKKSKSKLKRFLLRRQAFLDDLIHVDPATVNAVMDDIIHCFFPYRDREGRLIYYTRANFRFDLYTMHDVNVVGKALLLMVVKNPMTSVAGVSYIGDCQSPMQEYYQIIKNSKDFTPFALDLPIRLGRVDATRVHFLTRVLVATVRVFLSEKLCRRLHFHEKGFDEVKKAYHPSLLPSDVLEGTAGPLSDNIFRQRLLKFIEELKEERYKNLSCLSRFY